MNFGLIIIIVVLLYFPKYLFSIRDIWLRIYIILIYKINYFNFQYKNDEIKNH